MCNMNVSVKSLILLLLLLCPLLFGSKTFAEVTVTPLNDFEYTMVEERILLQKYKGTAETVCVAGSYDVDGTEYAVTLDTATVFRDNKKITFVTLNSGIQFATTVDGELRINSMNGLFQGCLKLSGVDLSDISTAGVTDMSYLFSNCQKLKALDLTNFDSSSVTTLEGLLDCCYILADLTGYENWDTRQVENMYKTFNRVSYSLANDDTRLKEIDLSKWDLSKLKNNAWCFQNCKVNSILLPDNLPIISAGFFNHAANVEGSSYTIPAGVKKIGYAHTFYDFGTEDFVEFKVAEGNTHYKAVDGILYSMDGTEMLAITRSKTFSDNTFVIPEGVTFLPELSFSRNNNVKRIVLPNSYVLRQYVPRFDPQYITFEDTGNLNDSNSLAIATYLYGATDYDVKADNPRYAAYDGILYTKDMSTLLAIPNLYDREIIVPEGVTHWEHDAIWVDATNPLKYAKGVHIPKSMIVIAPNQLEKLNWLLTKYGVKTTVHEDNPVYYVDENGYLQERPNVYGAVITLEQSSYTYDGTEKKPRVIVTVGDIVLKENVDYTIAYRNNLNAGTAQVQIEGIGKYVGTATKNFTIHPMSIAGASQPETGDGFSPLLWSCLMLWSAAGVLVMKKRFKNKVG